MAQAKKAVTESVAEKFGRALVDIPSHNLASGDYATLPADIANALAATGAFDTQAQTTEVTK